MLHFILTTIFLTLVTCRHRSADASGDLGGSLVTQLRNDANLDLSLDEDYEDLRAELLAYHTALAALTSGRRSMKTTPCWQLGGICVNHKLCAGHKSLSEVPGCLRNSEVCCFTWNNFQAKDPENSDIGLLAMPWSPQKEIGGKGVLIKEQIGGKRKRRPKKAIRDNRNLDVKVVDESPLSLEDSHSNVKRARENFGEKTRNKKLPLLVIVRTN